MNRYRQSPNDGPMLADEAGPWVRVDDMKSAQDSHELAGDLLDHEKIPSWPPLKKALWNVVTSEKLNDGHYINAYDLTDKLYAAASPPAPSSGTLEALQRDAKHLEGCEHPKSPVWLCNCPRPLLAQPAEAERAVAFANGPVELGYEAGLHLNWVADRLEHVHGENPNYDYMRRLRKIADALYTHPLPQAGADSELVEPVAWRIGDNGHLYHTREEADEHVAGWRELGESCAAPEPLYSAATLSQLHTRLEKAEFWAEHYKNSATILKDDLEAAEAKLAELEARNDK